MGAPGGQGQSNLPPWAQLVPFLLLFGVMYLVLILPQQKKEKQRGVMLKGLKVGDKIVTASGIVGVVVSIREHHVTLRSEDTKLELLKSAIQEVTERKA
jgi:preprotein translocase subunit YajC